MLFLLPVIILLLNACSPQNPAPVNNFGTTKGPGSIGAHLVTSGDNLYTISKNYRLPMRDIIIVNKLEPPYILKTGYRVQLPPPNDYKVRAKDSVYTIAHMHDVSVNQLVSLNSLNAPYTIYPGQVLRLPASYAHAPVPDQRPVIVPESNVQTALPTAKPYYPSAKVNKVSIPRAVRKPTPKLAGNGQFIRPVAGNIISSYGPKKGGLHNDGINIKAVRGTPVRAAQNGIVVYAGDELKGYGNLVLIKHGNNMMSAYAHMNKILIKRGAKILRGESIGTVGSTGSVDTPQLHFEIRKGAKPVNPEPYL